MLRFLSVLSSRARPTRRPQTVAVTPNPVATHRERLLAMRLEHLSLCSPRRCAQLADLGVETAGDLLWCDASAIASTFGAPDRAGRAMERFQAAVRLALDVDGMTPRDAMLLLAIHRRSADSLARETAATLRRDLERFSLSSQGSRLVGRRGIPSHRRIKTWITRCRDAAMMMPATGVGC